VEGDDEVQEAVEQVLDQLAVLPRGEGVLARVGPEVLQAHQQGVPENASKEKEKKLGK